MRQLVYSVLTVAQSSIDATLAGSRKIAVARTLIAAAQLSVLTFTDWDALFVPTAGSDFGPTCNSAGNLGAYCLMFDRTGVAPPSILLIIGLLFVLSGFFPRYAGLVHAWITISLSPAVKLPDGGESVAQIIVVLLAIVTLPDSRLNHWQRDVMISSWWIPFAWAASHLLRLQVVWVYLNAAIMKTAVPEWQDGTAVYFISLDPMFGTSGPFGPIFDWMVSIPVLSLMMIWGAIITEMSIALLLLGPERYRRIAVWLTVLLHCLFIAMIGLWSFAFVMIGAVLAATGPTATLRDMRGWSRSSRVVVSSKPVSEGVNA